MSSEIEERAQFSQIRYGQCWEDAEILLEGLAIQPGDTYLSIASAGDNTLALLTRSPERVIALDLSLAQLACLELRVAAYRCLTHPELLSLMGSTTESTEPTTRQTLYQRCCPHLSPTVKQFWDDRPQLIAMGIGNSGKFERYFEIFRRYILPLVHGKKQINQLLQGGILEERQLFYNQVWNSRRWRWMFRLFFSRTVMGNLGRDPSFFQYVNANVAERIFDRAEYALTQLNPADNPYLQWILTGHHTTALPYALRPEHFDTIRANLDHLEWHQCSVEAFLDQLPNQTIDRYNLSDMFEYMSLDSYHQILAKLIQKGRQGGRLAYWNLLVPRHCSPEWSNQIRPLSDLAHHLYDRDKAFFYSAFHVEEIV
ncbi:MAG: DUF3419 family protein [Roseofilum sp. SBFL]|uniref:DUF3419 family protein n=1 Tax=unclassified Roseofilum TaxID=2620099 RepID=UPI001B2A6E69|nr:MULTISPECIES: DUF3419 family protein [unclassified Roseofilum]MBP0013557.1 DUF3419 family protein [Roseofilum sp. SID3]MBP0022558.1 DUF3419 family protein [Roseofilum sp. SID2]MBP0039845.1 DUF3419 family protein [Roseofilum sp. SID1]MBP0041009.1 DUF3419 family protein [Roseofilum sp. SBFL]